jgi:hypothetical protein
MLMKHSSEMMQTPARMYIFLKQRTCHYAERDCVRGMCVDAAQSRDDANTCTYVYCRKSANVALCGARLRARHSC